MADGGTGNDFAWKRGHKGLSRREEGAHVMILGQVFA